jgi:hypothetical protein
MTIAAEEGTFGVVPDASDLLGRYRDARTRERVTTEEAVLRVIGRIMATRRDKAPTYLQDWPCEINERAWPAERSAVMLWRYSAAALAAAGGAGRGGARPWRY